MAAKSESLFGVEGEHFDDDDPSLDVCLLDGMGSLLRIDVYFLLG